MLPQLQHLIQRPDYAARIGFHAAIVCWFLMGGAMLVGTAPAAGIERLSAHQQLAFEIYKELVEINTVTATGDTARAAEAMAAWLRAAGFAESDLQVFAPAPRKGNLVARLRGTGARRAVTPSTRCRSSPPPA